MRYSSILLLGAGAIVSAGVAPPRPLITPGPSLEELQLKELELRIRRDASNINLGSLADVLATGVPPSILALALTNMPAVSKLLWSEFLDSNTPSWFTALPTDIQGYLSGEFGPTTTAASSTTASSASASASSTSSVPSVSATSVTTEASKKPYGTGLPTWAKVLIGVAVPIFVLGLFALVILCLVRRRRRRRLHKAGAESRAPTPAFISNSHRPREDNFGNHSEIVALNDPARHSAPITRKPVPQPTRIDRNSSSSEEYTTPPTHSFEDIPPPPVFGAQHSARNSRQSFSSLHSVPEVPEPGAAHFGAGVAPPPRSPRRSSREFNKEFGQGTKQPMPPLNPAANANYVRAQHRDVDSYIASQGLYAGGHNPYPRQNDKYEDYRHENPFSDPSPPRESGNMASGGYRGVDYDEEMYSPPPRNHGHNWPLHGGQDEEDRTFSFERGDDPGYPYKRH